MEKRESQEIFLQSKGKVRCDSRKAVLLKDLIDVSIEEQDIRDKINHIEYKMNHAQGQKTYVISMLSIISLIKNQFPNITVHVLGEPDILMIFQDVEVKNRDKTKLIRVVCICFLLFVGSATAIINFHSDVDMPQTQKTIYRIITGKETDQLLLLQIPYSLGIGTGMSIFFNHVFKKRINNEPSPLEVEVHLYQENMDQYIKNMSEKHNR
ncbi:stage V sporulation protein AA [Clostridium formicaceticum]|uniref:Stage V sporulation protein AA n=1 Tax=Clostridium formicaceticum TaxID=1497 RepID=A0AAC9RK97_9CLOT|nr:stage V sporulation protein AA [Clostridium formicaceticum]AOY76763.1 hypothetical protein BJL90_13420 [Clostridium formicaceticum]ARE87217.1 Stage V sporulation protein AA [Clostridium formicaceticum]